MAGLIISNTPLNSDNLSNQIFNITIETRVTKDRPQPAAVPPHFVNFTFAIETRPKDQLLTIAESGKASNASESSSFGPALATCAQCDERLCKCRFRNPGAVVTNSNRPLVWIDSDVHSSGF